MVSGSDTAVSGQLHDRAWVAREAVIADNGVVLTGELDDDDSMLCVAAGRDAACASGPTPAEVFSDWGPGYARLFGGVSYAEVDVVGSRPPHLPPTRPPPSLPCTPVPASCFPTPGTP